MENFTLQDVNIKCLHHHLVAAKATDGVKRQSVKVHLLLTEKICFSPCF